MGKRSNVTVSAAPKVTIMRDRNIVTVTDGRYRRDSVCSSPSAAKSLEKKLTNDAEAAARWVREKDPVQLGLPFADGIPDNDI